MPPMKVAEPETKKFNKIEKNQIENKIEVKNEPVNGNVEEVQKALERDMEAQ